MVFHILTIFPKIFDCYFNESIIKRARTKRLIKINVHNLRDYAIDKHKTTDDRPYGGGPGMIMKVEPVWRAVNKIESRIKNKEARIILFSPKGKKFDQATGKRLSRYDHLIMICGRYEGVDERVAKYIADEEISVGDYVLTGGEIPAMIIVDVVSRFVPGVLGKKESLQEESFVKKGFLEYPQYTRPEEFHGLKVPKVLLSGNHKKIEEWKNKQSESRIKN